MFQHRSPLLEKVPYQQSRNFIRQQRFHPLNFSYERTYEQQTLYSFRILGLHEDPKKMVAGSHYSGHVAHEPPDHFE
jgi:hypothetical protein